MTKSDSAAAGTPARQTTFDVEAWEGEDRVITMNGKPVGQSLSVRDAAVIKRWLPTAISELRAEPTPPSTGKLCRHCGEPEHITNDCHVSYTSAPKAPVSGEGTGTPDRRTQGLYGKFVVHRTDGRDAAGEKHDGCTYFVLDLQHDPHMPPALRAYAKSCEKDYPTLASQLRIVADDFGQRGEFVGIMAQKPALDLERQKAGEDTGTLLEKAVADRDARPWRYYRFERDELKKFCDQLADKVAAKDAQLAELTAIKKQAKCLRLEHLIDGNDLAKRSETIQALQTYEAVAALQIENKKLESTLADLRRQGEEVQRTAPDPPKETL